MLLFKYLSRKKVLIPSECIQCIVWQSLCAMHAPRDTGTATIFNKVSTFKFKIKWNRVHISSLDSSVMNMAFLLFWLPHLFNVFALYAMALVYKCHFIFFTHEHMRHHLLVMTKYMQMWCIPRHEWQVPTRLDVLAKTLAFCLIIWYDGKS